MPHTEFALSAEELDRRRGAYARLTAFIALGAVASSIDLLLEYPLYVAPGLLVLVVVLFASRRLFFDSLARYAQVTWTVTAEELVRAASGTTESHPLRDIKRLRVKRTVTDSVRAVSVDLAQGRSHYVNALESPERFLERLTGVADFLPSPIEVKEWIDYDHPRFYRLLGLGIGAALTSTVRLGISVSGTGVKVVYIVLAVYACAFGAYWLYRTPIARSYGRQRGSADIAVGLGALLAGAALGLAATVM